MKRISTLLAAGALGALAVPAAASAEPVAQLGAPTSVREYAGNIAFSQFDPATQQWRLAVRRAGLPEAELLPVAPSSRPFQPDIGPDSAGRPALIYQRCADTTGPLSGCDLFVYSLDGATGERPVNNANDPENNDVAATIWRGRIAWTREYGTGPDANPIVYTKTLTAPRSHPSARLPGVPQRRCGDVDRVCGPTTDRGVNELELWGENLAQSVTYGCRGCAGIAQTELRLVDLGDRSARQVAFQVVGLSGQSFIGPSFTPGGRLAWYRACLGDPSGCVGGRSGPFRTTLTTRRYERGPGGPAAVYGFADTGAALYEVLRCSEETQGPFNADCHVERLPAPAYTPTRAPLR